MAAWARPLRRLRGSPSPLGSWVPDLPETPPAGLDHENHLVAVPSLLRPPSGLGIRQPPGTGILTCCPSPTGFPLGLGTDSPWVDERCPGILRLSAKTVLASFNATHAGILSSFRSRCPFGHPSLQAERSSTTTFRSSAASVSCLSPVTFSAQTPLTSELLRTL